MKPYVSDSKVRHHYGKPNHQITIEMLLILHHLLHDKSSRLQSKIAPASSKNMSRINAIKHLQKKCEKHYKTGAVCKWHNYDEYCENILKFFENVGSFGEGKIQYSKLPPIISF